MPKTMIVRLTDGPLVSEALGSAAAFEMRVAVADIERGGTGEIEIDNPGNVLHGLRVEWRVEDSEPPMPDS